MKVIIKAMATGLLKLLSQEGVQEFLIETARSLAKKTEFKGDDQLVDWFADVWEKSK